MFSCQLLDGRPQIFCVRNYSIYTRWKVDQNPDGPWTHWTLFKKGTYERQYTGVGAGAGYYPISLLGKTDGFPIIAYVMERPGTALPGDEKYGEVHVSALGLMPDRTVWKEGKCYAPPGNANTARVTSIAASTYADPNSGGGGVQLFFGIEYSADFGDTSGREKLPTRRTDIPNFDAFLRDDSVADFGFTAARNEDFPSNEFEDDFSKEVLTPTHRKRFVAAGQLPNGQIQIFLADDLGRISTSWKEKGRWTKWSKFYEDSGMDMESMCAYRLSNGTLALFILSGSEVYFCYKTLPSMNSGWSDMVVLKGIPGSSLKHLTVCQLTDNRLQVFVDSGHGNIYTFWQLPSEVGGWSDPVEMRSFSINYTPRPDSPDFNSNIDFDRGIFGPKA